ncbi:MAG TPA: PadR family transcriptional regulator [Solirubrobacterales bacterium]|nr:PadR family transcriptional regulator [Solirubrobacterales bacterium]
MALKYAVLGLLAERRSYGYDLVHDLSDRLGPAWQLGASSVYAALDKLEDEGLIRTCPHSTGNALSGSRDPAVRRVTFEATAAGREAFGNWIARPDCRMGPIRSELYLKVAVARPQDVPALLRAVENACRLSREAQLECAEQFEPLRGDRWQRAAAMFARTGALDHLEAERHWLARLRAFLLAPPAERLELERTLIPGSA